MFSHPLPDPPKDPAVLDGQWRAMRACLRALIAVIGPELRGELLDFLLEDRPQPPPEHPGALGFHTAIDEIIAALRTEPGRPLEDMTGEESWH